MEDPEASTKTSPLLTKPNIGRKKRMSKKERKALKKQNNLDQNNSKDKTKETPAAPPTNSDNEDRIEQECMKSYVKIPIPEKPSSDIVMTKQKKSDLKQREEEDPEGGGGGGRTLGKWFPNAQLVKCALTYTNTGKLIINNNNQKYNVSQKAKDNPNGSTSTGNPRSSLVLFYQYTKEKKWSQERLKLLMTHLVSIAKKRNIGGRIRVAQEGVNATVSAVDMPNQSTSSVNIDTKLAASTARETIRHFAQDLRNFDPEVFAETDFKYIDDLPADRHFKELKILPVQELVFYGIKDGDAPISEDNKKNNNNNDEGGGVHLDAKEYHEMLQKNNTVVIDVRNHYEAVLGRFDGQMMAGQESKSKDKTQSNVNPEKVASSGAEYIDPQMRKSTDFTKWLSEKESKEKLKDKTVLMYCTGGIRCERASSYLKKQMGKDVKGVFQLKGGIERYLKEFPDGGMWRGKNFVFDKREAVGAGNLEGDGGVIRKQNGKGSKDNASKSDLPAKCCVCGTKWDRYVGKKKCYTCGVPVLMCDQCMSKKPDKTPGQELSVRCPLCVKENITVPASEVDFTANGINNTIADPQLQETTSSQVEIEGKDASSKPQNNKRKAADSVLKWGGGYAAKRKGLRKMKRKLCQFGSECRRKDCYFAHPEREQCQKVTKKE